MNNDLVNNNNSVSGFPISPNVNLHHSKERVSNKELTLFFYIKVLYQHSIIYDYKPEKLSKLTGLAPNTIRKYVGNLKSIGYVENHKGNLLFKSKSKFDELEQIGFRRKNYTKTNYKDFTDLFNLSLIENNIRAQNWAIKQHKLSNPKRIRPKASQIRNAKENIKNWKEFNNEVLLSSRGLSKVLNLSHTTIVKMLKRLQEKGIIKIKMNIQKVFFGSYSDFLHFKSLNSDLYYFYSKRTVFVHKGIILIRS